MPTTVLDESDRLLACFLVALACAVLADNASAQGDSAGAQARTCIRRIALRRGVCAVVSTEPAELAIDLAQQTEWTIYVSVPSRSQALAVRKVVDTAGMLGTRIYVADDDWPRIGLATNLADAVVVMPSAAERFQTHSKELLRVVRPLGKVLLGDRELVKPYPAQADDWTHPYHGPDNNPLSTDQLARAPYLTQFLGEPFHVPFPEVTVTAAGRVFRAFGHVGYKQRDWRWLNRLVAFNGYNGTILWERSLEEGFNIHRNSMVATPDILYLADSQSCKLLDTATGRLISEIHAPEGATGSVWKWMAIEDGILYGLVGKQQFRDATVRGTRTQPGWPWRPMTAGYDAKQYPWGFGRTVFAVNLHTRKVLWKHIEEQAIDGRAIAMSHGRIYYDCHPDFLACLDVQTGKVVWRNSDRELLDAIGTHQRAQTARLGFQSTAYMKCSDRAIYFAGPQQPRLAAASTRDGHLLWQFPHGNYQLVLRPEGLYAMGRTGPSRLFDPMTGAVRANLNCLRGNCTRVTGTIDSIFCRGHDHAGTLRLKVPANQPRRIALMRPDCHDGVIAAGGMVYWGPWMCDCSLSLVGHIALAPAGDFDFNSHATESDRLESTPAAETPLQPLKVQGADWPTYRADNERSGASAVSIPEHTTLCWTYRVPKGVTLTAPVTVGDTVFVAGSDGILRALDVKQGACRWKSYTGGPILFPPSIAGNRLFVGSGDGWVYAFEAATGDLLWRFRAAPVDRIISVHGRLCSTWPVASGVLVDRGVAYAAAGIASYDGTHVYALDAATGHIRWQNNMSGHMFGGDRVTGVSVQGHLLLHNDRLYLAGGNVISPAIYDTQDGRCLNQLVDEWGGQKPPPGTDWHYTPDLERRDRAQKEFGKAPRGCDLFLVGDKVIAFDRLLYGPKEYWQGRYFSRNRFLQAGNSNILCRAANGRLRRIDAATAGATQPKSVWDVEGLDLPVAMAVSSNAILVAGRTRGSKPDQPDQVLVARSLTDGHLLWSQSLPALPAWWGLAIDRDGHILTTASDGSLGCFTRAGR